MPASPVTVCLIQDYLPPYRIPLFTKIAEADGIDFTLLMMARRHASYEQWEHLWRNPPFRCVLVDGWRFRFSSDMESGFNPALFFTLMRLRPDVVICSGFSLNTILALAYKLLFRKRVVVWTEATATTESSPVLSAVADTDTAHACAMGRRLHRRRDAGARVCEEPAAAGIGARPSSVPTTPWITTASRGAATPSAATARQLPHCEAASRPATSCFQVSSSSARTSAACSKFTRKSCDAARHPSG